MLMLMFPMSYAFLSQLQEPQVPYYEHLKVTYLRFFELEWLVVSSIGLSIFLGVFSHHIFSQFSNLVYMIQKYGLSRKVWKSGPKEELEKRQEALLAGGGLKSSLEIEDLNDIGIEDFRYLFAGGKDAIAPCSYLSFYFWTRKQEKDLTLREFRFYYSLFQGIKGLMGLVCAIFILAGAFLMVAHTFSLSLDSFEWMKHIIVERLPQFAIPSHPDLRTLLVNLVTFSIALLVFYCLWRGADQRMKDYRTALSGSHKVLFTKWLDSDEENFKLFVRELEARRYLIQTPK